MALPAIAALSRAFDVEVHAPRWGGELFDGLRVVAADAPPRGSAGALFKPSFGAAWRWRGLERRAGLATAGRGWLLTDALPVRPDEHRSAGYARVAASFGVPVLGAPRYGARGVAPELPAGFVALNPWSRTPPARWPHFRALADSLEEPVVFFAGPGEADEVRAIAGPHRVVSGLSLPDLAAALDRCRVFVSGDTGAGHFAAACGARVVMLHGSTAPGLTGAGEAIEGPDLWCRPCYRKSCPFGVACLARIPAATVGAAL